MDFEKVSIIIPTYNRSNYVLKALGSVLKQDYNNIEVLIINDASTDDTSESLSKIVDSRLKIITLEKNSGAQVARNTGIQQATGSIIMFLDSDDEFVPESISRRVEIFQRIPKCHVLIVGYWFQKFSETNNTHRPEILKSWMDGNVYGKLLRTMALAPTSAITVRKLCFENIGLFDETLVASQDDDMLLRLSREYEFNFLHEPLVYFNSPKIERVSTNLLRYASGFHQIVRKHQAEILKTGGGILLMWHYARTAWLFEKADNPEYSQKIFDRQWYNRFILVLFYLIHRFSSDLKNLIKPIYHHFFYINKNENSH